jgi:hypothetical protein
MAGINWRNFQSCHEPLFALVAAAIFGNFLTGTSGTNISTTVTKSVAIIVLVLVYLYGSITFGITFTSVKKD